MRKTQILTIAATAAATLGLTAALGFRQPDGIDPPPGPVADTHPSLASISQQINDLAVGVDSQIFDFFATPRIDGGTSFVWNVGAIQLKRVHMLIGNFIVTDATGKSFRIFASQTSQFERNNAVEFNFDITLQGPITLTVLSNNQLGAEANIIYRELP